jgi:hypothetical protein
VTSVSLGLMRAWRFYAEGCASAILWAVRRLLPLLVVAVIALAPAAMAASPKPPNFSACHVSHACPSNTHSYLWRGLFCADRAHRSTADKVRTVWRGRTWWCHAKTVAPAPAPPPPPPAPPQPVDPLATFKPLVSTFVQQYLDTALQQVRTDAGGGYAALANGSGLAALQNCAATLTSTVGAPPPDPTALSAFSQLQTMCNDFQSAASEIRDGVAANDPDKVNAGLDLFKAGRDLRDSIVRLLGLGL